jgi:tetratricopeptide (TPR) repeat protein
LLSLFTPTFAQSPGSITGKVVLPDGSNLAQGIRISLETMRGVKSNVYTDNQGAFAFRGLTPGSYQIIVEADKTLWETTTANLEVFPGAPAILTITLKPKKTTSTKPKGGDSVTATELGNSVPPKAQKEFDRATEATRQGKVEDAITHLRKAIDYYPGYLMARNDLGAQLLEQGKLEEAEKELRAAIAIDSKAFNPHLNLGIVLIAQKQFPESEEVLRKAVSFDPKSPAARFYLGQSLEGLEQFVPAIREFNTAHNLGGTVFAVALFHLGNVYLRLGDREQALTSFRKYVAEAPKGSYFAEAQRKIQGLQH